MKLPEKWRSYILIQVFVHSDTNLEISSLRKGLKSSPCGNEYKERVCVGAAATSHKINTAGTTNNRNNKDRLI